MKDSEYKDLYEFAIDNSGLVPANENADELLVQCVRGEVVTFKEVSDRQIAFHRAYFSLLGYIYDYMPNKFKVEIPKKIFYQFVKHLKRDYDIKYEFKDDEKYHAILDYCLYVEKIEISKAKRIAKKFGKIAMIEYESISFGRMDQKKFEAFVSKQLPFIYSHIIGKFFDGEKYDNIIYNIENDFKKLLGQLP